MKSIRLSEVVELVILFSSVVSVIGRVIQILYLRYKLRFFSRQIILILILSQLTSWLITGIFWHLWPFEMDVMCGIFCIPTIISEFIILSITFSLFKKRADLWV